MHTLIKKYAKPWEMVVLAVSLLVMVELVFVLQWQDGRFTGKPVLRVAAPDTEWLDSELTPYGVGFEKELLDRFCSKNKMTWTLIRTRNWSEAWEEVRKGRADMVIGLGSEPPDSLEIRMTAGPAYAHTRPVLIYNDKRFGLGDDSDMFERPVLLTANTVMADSLRQKADELNRTPRTVVSADLTMTPLLDTLDRNQARFALVDQRRFALLQPFYRTIKTAKTLDTELEYRWYWSERSPALDESLHRYWADIKASGRLDNLYDKYFGFLPNKTDHYELHHMVDVLEEKLPIYHQAITKAAKHTGIDPLFLVAIIYQESRFNAEAHSDTGVRGLMQITTATAEHLGVDRTDPFQSIAGGSRYLKQLYNDLGDLGLDKETRWLFTLASYNRGPGHLRDAVDLAKRLGGTGRSWLELKTVFPKLGYEAYYKDAKYGYTRGAEVVDYVESIRYYRYILNGLIILARPEAQELSTLVSASGHSIL